MCQTPNCVSVTVVLLFCFKTMNTTSLGTISAERVFYSVHVGIQEPTGHAMLCFIHSFHKA